MSVQSAAPRQPAVPDLLAALEGELRGLLELHRELLGVIESKLDAMRRGEASAIQRCAERERRVVQRIQRHEAQRCCVTRDLGRATGAPSGPAGGETPLRTLLTRVPEHWQQRLQAVGGELAQVLEGVGRANARATAVARQVQDWHRGLLAETSAAFGTAGVYSRNGHAWSSPPAQVIDTTQ